MPRIQFSLIISVLGSYEVMRRQCLHLASIVPEDAELILLDDGSDPPLPVPDKRPKHFSMVYTRNSNPWTQPIARNLGARLSRGDYLLFTDIDHIVSHGAVQAVCRFTGSRMMFPRSIAVLNDQGQISTASEALRMYGSRENRDPELAITNSVHQNTFAIRRELFLDAMQGGYDESLCTGGKYGGDDIEFNRRYAGLVATGRAQQDVLGPAIFVYPDPASSTLFHGLQRVSPSS